MVIKSIKMHERFFNKIKSGEKQLEVRKLSSGYKNGIYTVYEPEGKKHLGYIKMEKVLINPVFENIYFSVWKEMLVGNVDKVDNGEGGFLRDPNDFYSFDDESAKFVRENYISKKIPIVVYLVEWFDINRIRKESDEVWLKKLKECKKKEGK